jgi:hypothetical protein
MRYRALFPLVGLAAAFVPALADTTPLPTAQVEKLHALIKPQAGESRWMEIDWYPNVWEARQKAAAEGKPLFLMAGSGGAPPAGC